ncbi:MAG: hypothetical protein M3083_02430 [Actinomycetota bacterium]|nr:hypothetical protein [Actinomycetota bacterium]
MGRPLVGEGREQVGAGVGPLDRGAVGLADQVKGAVDPVDQRLGVERLGVVRVEAVLGVPEQVSETVASIDVHYRPVRERGVSHFLVRRIDWVAAGGRASFTGPTVVLLEDLEREMF